MSSAIVTEMQRTFMQLESPIDPLPPAGKLVAGLQQSYCSCYRCKPNLYRQHRSNPGTFKPGQHDHYALATHAVAWFTVPVALDNHVVQGGQTSQQVAREVWRQLCREYSILCDHLPSSALTKVAAKKIVPHAMGIFSTVFFLCALNPRKKRLALLWSPTECTLKSLSWLQGDRIVVRINAHHPYHTVRPSRSLNSITLLHTLLQEMLNAFFDLYGCYNGTTCGTAECRFVSRQNTGNRRGRAWHMLAKAIEDEAPRLLPGFTPRFERRRMMVNESLRGGYTPSTCDLEQICGDLELLARVLQKVRTRDDDDKMMDVVHRWAARSTVMPRPKRRDLRRTKSEVLRRDEINFRCSR